MRDNNIKTSGIIVPPLTPFTSSLKIDFDALEAGVNDVIERSAPDLIIAAGVEAQEYQFLPFGERLDLIRATIEAVDGRCPVAVGISHPSFKVAIELGHFAVEYGAAAVQLLAPQKPTGGTPTTAELLRYFELIGQEIPLQIILYLNPGPGADVSIPATIELAKLDCIQFIKESSRDLARVARLLVEIEQAGLARYYTTMQMLLITLELGGAGVTLPPPAAILARQIIQTYETGDIAKAAKLQQVFGVYPSRWMSYGLAAVMKASANFLGLPAGDPYPPYEPVRGRDLESLHVFLKAQSHMFEGKVHA